MNIRVDRFTTNHADEAFDRLIEVRATPIQLGRSDPLSDSDAFVRAAKAICLSDKQVRRLVRELMGIAAEHARASFPSDAVFLRQLGTRNPWGTVRLSAICFTGLSGVGKSMVLAAFQRLFSSLLTHSVPGYQNLPLTSSWSLSLEDGVGLNGLLGPILWPELYRKMALDAGTGPDAMVQPKGQALPALLTKARLRAWRDAVCIVFADEFQNIAKGSATARATSLLHNLLSLGPRLCFCANYSLVNGLWEGNPEDVRRLLTVRLEMLPDAKGSAAYTRHLDELKKLAPEVFTFDVVECQEFIHDSTFGVKDYVVQLLRCAYVASRSRGGSGVVGLNELKSGFASDLYSPTRRAVETLWSQYVQNKKIDARYWSPFRQPGDPWWATDEDRAEDTKDDATAKVVVAQRAIDEYARRVNDALIEAAQQPVMPSAPEKPKAPPRRRGKVVALIPRNGPRSDLKKGADLLDDL